MRRKDTAIEADRRSFLKLAGLGAVAGTATLVTGEAEAVEADKAAGSGYRETEHVKTFYDTARF
ncbi:MULTISPECIES: twin-arginine translocation signal domain-containing protein [Stappia]|jgi:hypothetical protein|uniref:Twin-arginine translocation signal domain-containing protein n=1 Tax=Stappia indica TaxID=538381 RepID=A0A857C2H4_9HYPH|nr:MULTISPECIES: twin-arginine translocation signal domain-containing protein [Stappia]MBC2859265.1 twin-arginine translocation signal domain-containing protein [Stappia sp. 28M-7]QGZ33059.1 twin-arginine translocation signal domain-containing protein [Stappia indica]